MNNPSYVSLFARALELCQSRWRKSRCSTLPSLMVTGRAGVQANIPEHCQSRLQEQKVSRKWTLEEVFDIE